MDLFKIIVLVIALTLLIIILTLVGILINKTNHLGSVYPPTINHCPDNWLIDSSANCIIPSNGNLGTLSPANYTSIPGYYFDASNNISMINFSDPGWLANGMTAYCNQKLWANTNNIVWDTISNYNQC